jgi:uncharacterized protein (DUF1015 family)
MAEIRPFQGVRYNTAVVGDLSNVICPPYDIISSEYQKELYDRSPYNFVRIEYGRELPQDSASDNKYMRAAATLDEWLKNRVLATDGKPTIYVNDHYFIHHGVEMKRRGLIVRVRLEEWAKMVVRPHEGTLSAPKSDRISLLWALNANTSPILSMYEDSHGRVASMLDQVTVTDPAATVHRVAGERHELWMITDEKTLSQIAAELQDNPIYIADGHHRYESALTYQREHRALYPAAPHDAPFNFVMMTLIAFDDPGMLILPPHRLLRGLPAVKLMALKDKIPSFFDIETISLDRSGDWQKADGRLNQPDKLCLALFGLDGRNLWILTLKDFDSASRLMPYFHTDIYKKLDVSMVDHIILEDMLGLKTEGESGIAFNYDRDDAVKKVLAREFQLAFIVKPVKPATIKEIADASDRMPRKSTYFYPKLPSGLVLNRLV